MEIMKTAKKLVGMLLVLVMIFSMTAIASAETETGSITINNATKGNTYKVYKVFSAYGNGTAIRYELVQGKNTAPAGFEVENGNVSYAGNGEVTNLTANDIAAIAEYVAGDTPVKEVTATNDGKLEIKDLPNGYYYITTTTGTAVTITSTNPSVTVSDKNEAPELDKKITGVDAGSYDKDGMKALAQVGTKVTYTATIQVKNGAENYVFHDKMENGLSYNNDVAVKVDGSPITSDSGAYTTDKAEGDTITLRFNNDWIKNQVNKSITITYSATVTSDALIENPAENTASLDYGHKNTITSGTPKVYNAKFTVIKTDGSSKALAGAGFVIKNSSGNYYKYDTSDAKVEWVSEINKATEYITDVKNGKAEVTFAGLADGTYTLIEKTVPDGYNKAADSTFTIDEDNYDLTNLSQSTIVENQSGSLLPSTGGMGTTIFYLLGAVLVIGAGVLLVARRRVNAKK